MDEDSEDEGSVIEEKKETVVAGSFVLEEYTWQSIETNLPTERLATTGVKGAVLKLKPRYTGGGRGGGGGNTVCFSLILS